MGGGYQGKPEPLGRDSPSTPSLAAPLEKPPPESEAAAPPATLWVRTERSGQSRLHLDGKGSGQSVPLGICPSRVPHSYFWDLQYDS